MAGSYHISENMGFSAKTIHPAGEEAAHGTGRDPGATETERGRVFPTTQAKSDYWSADGGLSACRSWQQ